MSRTYSDRTMPVDVFMRTLDVGSFYRHVYYALEGYRAQHATDHGCDGSHRVGGCADCRATAPRGWSVAETSHD